MPHYRKLLDSIDSVVAEVKKDASLGDKTYEVYRRLTAIIKDTRYWFYDSENEGKKARTELQKLLTDIQKEFKPSDFHKGSWKKLYEPLFYAATATPAELVNLVFGETGGTLLLPSDKFYKDKAAAERARKLSDAADKNAPRRVFVLDPQSMGKDHLKECNAEIEKLDEKYDAAWEQWKTMKEHLEKGEEVPKAVVDSHKKALDAYNTARKKLKDNKTLGSYVI